MFGELFKWLTLGVILAFGVTLVTHAEGASQVLSTTFQGYNTTLTTLEGR